MSFDYPSGHGSKSASLDYQSLHDLAEVFSVERVSYQMSWLFTSLGLLGQGTRLALPGADVCLLPSAVLVSGPAETFPVPPALQLEKEVVAAL